MLDFVGVEGLVFIVPLVVLLVCFVLIPLCFRIVVDTNKVHIVQSKKKTTSYGAGMENGNVYYNWPSWIPVIGVTRIVLPVNNFSLQLDAYKAYDKERVPFELDVTAFFRVKDTNLAAERVANFESLHEQLKSVVQGSVRTILASHDINQIMTDRATFGRQFTEEVKMELESWGVEPVKSMELMDIRDSEDSRVIANIMAKKSSYIEMESRVEVAQNMKKAQAAEIEAEREVEMQRQSAEQAVGQRTAEKDKEVGIARELAQQSIKLQQTETEKRDIDIRQVKEVGDANIKKQAAIIEAEQQKETMIICANGQLEATKRDAEGVTVDGEAQATALKAMQMAPVAAQIELAKEIGSNLNYQQYLVALEVVKAYQRVGEEQAKALSEAEMKVMVNGGDVPTGVKNAMEIFSPQGGQAFGGMLETLSQTPTGKSLLESLATKFLSPTHSIDEQKVPS
ncbi:SPFH domain-containing protein [Aeromonas dhakensis]|uniref:SPFH domain-containing protein n=2 Tax=Aeromonas dhakensis TaxID=196024 RepID=UPI00227B1DFD|nr:SPFH domain-containing protein [Aeromonas dhakensis]MDH0177926.1 SPFH domain-containing protein [Aeromonas dhakensis]WAF75691.1 SPFH domain-containing protein [Aeromonas dhakensis]